MGELNLRWNNHITNILQVFVEHLSSESFVDVTLSCEGRFIKAHKIILSACSPYFQELFQSHQSKHPVIILNGVKYEDLQAMIRFMYNGEIRVEESELSDLLATAESLQVKGLCNVRDGRSDKEDEKSSQLKEEQNFKEHEVTSQIDAKGDVDHDGYIEEKETSRPKKRRKMSHTVNQLANETTFTTTKTLRLDVEEPPASPYYQPLKIFEGAPKKLKIKSKVKPERPPIIYGPEKIRRPPNAFMIFANEWRRRLATEHPKESNIEISVRLGIMWKVLSNEIKDSYYALAKKVNEEHKRKYPGYYYSPKEARMRKNLKQDLMVARCLPSKDYFGNSIKLSQVCMKGEEQSSLRQQ